MRHHTHQPFLVLPQRGAITCKFSPPFHTGTNYTPLNSKPGHLCDSKQSGNLGDGCASLRSVQGWAGLSRGTGAELPDSASTMASPQGLSVELDTLLHVNNEGF